MTSASSWSSSPTGCTTCGRCTICPEERRIKIAQETLDIYAPIANRLGMSKVKNELEELSFKYLEPKAYEALRAKVEAKRKSAEAVIDELTRALRTKLEDAQVPVIQLDGRIKRLYSIHLKLKRQKIDLERVYDFVALRVITQSVKDCYGVLGIIHQTWSPVPGRIKDFIAMPRPNGYQSLHTSVISEHGFPLEVQIRTDEMHRRAEEGIAAHWKYKEGRVGDHRDERYFQWMRQLLEVQQEVRDPAEFLQNLKIDLYPEEVYIFTPKGEVRSLPRGATAVDFAYTVHTDVGHQCVGRAHQRPHGAAAHATAERRHHRDRHAVRAQAEPRLADVRGDVARPQQDPARPAHRGADAQHRARTPPVRQGSAPLQSQSGDGAGKPGAHQVREQSTAPSRPTNYSRTSATASSRPAPCCRNPSRLPSCTSRRRSSRWSGACCGRAARAPTRSRSAAPTM